MKKKLKLGLVTVVCAVVVGGVSYKVYADSVYKDKVALAMKETASEDKKIVMLEKSVADFYDEETADFLTKDMSEEQLQQLLESVDSYTLLTFDVETPELVSKWRVSTEKLTDIEKKTADITEKFAVQTAINGFFQKGKAINGKEVNSGLVIVDNLKKDQLAPYEAMSLSEEWSKAINDLVENARGQLEQIVNATKATDALFKDKKVSDKATRKELEKAQAEVKKIKNDKARKGQETRLKQVSDELSKKEKEVAETKAKETGGTVVATDNGGYEVADVGTQGTDSGYQPSGGGQSSSNTGNQNNSGGGNDWVSPNPGNGGNVGTPPSSGGNGGGTVTPPVTPPTPQAPTLVTGTIGNGGVFDSYNDAVDWGENQMLTSTSSSGSYMVSTLFYSDGTTKYSPHFIAG